MLTDSNTLLLASNSPRRREILTTLGYHVITQASDIDETPHNQETAAHYVQRLAIEKNRIARQHIDLQLKFLPIVSADTSVVLNQRILGKPDCAQTAIDMLHALSGQTHQVLTAVCVYFNEQERFLVQTNHVQFQTLTQQQIIDYVATKEPMDKAGAYGIQGIGGLFVTHLSGSFTGVMGLPVFETIELLRQCHAPIPPFKII